MTIRRSRSILCVAAVVLALGGCAAGASPPTPAGTTPSRPPSTQPVVAPAWQVGDRWVYEWSSGKETGTNTAEVIGTRDIGNAKYYVVRVGDAEHYYTEALHWASLVRDGRVEARMVPPQPWFEWPLVPGARWSGQSRFEQRDGAATYVDRFSVIGSETVEVPAGRYEAVKLTRETDRRDGDEYWYAPRVRWYVRWVGRRGDVQYEERLREYHPAARPR
jgi:hypothetical protein